MVESSPHLAAGLAEVRRGNGQESFRVAPAGPVEYDDTPGDESFTLSGGSRYKIAASNRKAARGLSVDHLLADELREWHSSDGWSALYYTTMARSTPRSGARPTWVTPSRWCSTSSATLRCQPGSVDRDL